MKNVKLLVLGLLLAVSPLVAATAESILLTGQKTETINGQMVVSGSASATVKNDTGGMRITADQFILDERGVLRCAGAVTVHVGLETLRVKELSIDTGRMQAFVLNPNGIALGSAADAPKYDAVPAAQKAWLDFTQQLSKTETALPRRASER